MSTRRNRYICAGPCPVNDSGVVAPLPRARQANVTRSAGRRPPPRTPRDGRDGASRQSPGGCARRPRAQPARGAARRTPRGGGPPARERTELGGQRGARAERRTTISPPEMQLLQRRAHLREIRLPEPRPRASRALDPAARRVPREDVILFPELRADLRHEPVARAHVERTGERKQSLAVDGRRASRGVPGT